MTGLGIALGVIFLLMVAYILILNGLNKSRVKIDEAESGIDVALTKRFDVLTKMLETVKAYTKHEKTIMLETVRLRSNASIKEKQIVSNKIDNNIEKLNVVAENYPQLLSSENYKTLQLSIVDTEEHLQAARRFYNSAVSVYNQKLVTFPISIIANIHHHTSRQFFEAEENKKHDVEMKF